MHPTTKIHKPIFIDVKTSKCTQLWEKQHFSPLPFAHLCYIIEFIPIGLLHIGGFAKGFSPCSIWSDHPGFSLRSWYKLTWHHSSKLLYFACLKDYHYIGYIKHKLYLDVFNPQLQNFLHVLVPKLDKNEATQSKLWCGPSCRKHPRAFLMKQLCPGMSFKSMCISVPLKLW